VAVDNKIVSGSSVRELTWHERLPGAGGMDNSRFETRGSAVVVDLGARGVLFVTLHGWLDRGPSKGRSVSPDAWTPVPALQPILGPPSPEWRDRTGVSAPVALDDLPVMVTFADPRRPDTVRLVDPGNLAATFGPGVALQSVTVEITRDGVDRDAALRALPWLATWGQRSLSGRMAIRTQEIADVLASTSFVRNR
jgi:hypothetical protein